jgi:hypothetical protein
VYVNIANVPLSAAAIDDLFCRQHPRNTTISFFFCQFDNAKSLQARTILSCLIRQCLTLDTLSKGICDQLETLFTSTLPDAEELGPLFCEVAGAFQTHFIVLDGFDECPRADRDVVLRVLDKLVSSSKPTTKILLASREDIGRDIQRRFKSLQHRTMACQEASADIASYIEEVIAAKIDEEDLEVGDPKLIFDIRDTLLRGAHGMSVLLVQRVL